MSIKSRAKDLIESRHMLSGIGFVSFLESTLVPIPLEALLVPLMQARRDKLWLIALMATIGCLLGALAFYAVGYFLFDVFETYITQTLTTQAQFDEFTQRMEDEGFLFVFSTGVTPIPLQIATLAAGVTSYNLLLFILATALGRIIRYFGLAVLVFFLGDQAEALIKKYHWQVAVVSLMLILGLWFWWQQ